MSAIDNAKVVRAVVQQKIANGVLSEADNRAILGALAHDGKTEAREVDAVLEAVVQGLDHLDTSTPTRRKNFNALFGALHATTLLPVAPAEGGDFLSPIAAAALRHETGQLGPAVAWAGNFGRLTGHEARYSRGLPDPVYFAKSGGGHDAMVLTAELYVPGVTDRADGSFGELRIEVLTDLGYGGGPGAVRAYRLDPEQHGERVGNNLRLFWDVGQQVGRAALGTYEFQLRVSSPGRPTVYLPEVAPRQLVIVGDSTGVPAGAALESSLLHKVGELSPGRVRWVSTPELYMVEGRPGRPLPAGATYEVVHTPATGVFIELRLQVYAPGITDRDDLSREERTVALAKLGAELRSPFFANGVAPLTFLHKAGIDDNDDVASFSLASYLTPQVMGGGALPPSGDYPVEVWAGGTLRGVLTLHWVDDRAA